MFNSSSIGVCLVTVSYFCFSAGRAVSALARITGSSASPWWPPRGAEGSQFSPAAFTSDKDAGSTARGASAQPASHAVAFQYRKMTL